MHRICVLVLFSLVIKSIDSDKVKLTEKKTPADNRTTTPIFKSSSPNIYFNEQFQNRKTWPHWMRSQARKDGVDAQFAKYDGQWSIEVPDSSVYKDNYALVLKSKEKHHAISANLDKPFDFTPKTLVVQYEVKFLNGLECGGAYIKLLSYEDQYPDLKQITDKTPYTIMFGPDKCSSENKYHFIVRFRNPISGNYTEHHAKKPSESIETYFTDKRSHLFTLILSSDNSFKMLIDHKVINSGNLLTDLEPTIIPSKEINDENDRKPDYWDEQEEIVDTNAKKPIDWDETAPREIPDPLIKIPNGWLENEPQRIPDPNAKRPENWNDAKDGTWQAPLIDNPVCQKASGCGPWKAPLTPNPAYRGPWQPPMIKNPNYRGKYVPRQIPNPYYFEEADPYKLTPIGSLSLELWSLNDGMVFDNFLITSDPSIAEDYADQLWDQKSILEGRSPTVSAKPKSAWQNFIDSASKDLKRNPWLLILYIIIILLVIIILLLAYYILREPKPKKRSNRSKKKTDEISEDDDDDTEEDDGEDEPLITKSDANQASSVTRRSRVHDRKE